MTFEQPDGVKVIILPESFSKTDTYESIQLPNPRTLSPLNFLINKQTHQLLELKLFNYQNPHILKNVITTRDGKVVKSLIFNNDKDGIILENADFLIGTEFNFIYLLISYYERSIEALNNDKENFKIRLYNLPDLIESFEDDKLIFGNLPKWFWESHEKNKSLMNAIDIIFDKFEENDEIYYKLNQVKILNYLTQKLDSIVRDFPNSMYKKLILEKLTPLPIHGVADGTLIELSKSVIKSAKIHHSLNIISCYISPLLSLKLSKVYNDDLKILDDHKKYLSSLDQGQQLAQENLTMLNSNLKIEKRKTVTPTGKQPSSSKKKIVKKVQVGKGALDGFFKKG